MDDDPAYDGFTVSCPNSDDEASGLPSKVLGRIKELERELRRKDKALAETAALLVLKKKVQAIWGDEDDDTEPKSGK